MVPEVLGLKQSKWLPLHPVKQRKRKLGAEIQSFGAFPFPYSVSKKTVHMHNFHEMIQFMLAEECLRFKMVKSSMSHQVITKQPEVKNTEQTTIKNTVNTVAHYI